MLTVLTKQSVQPEEIVIVDVSNGSNTEILVANGVPGLLSSLLCFRADVAAAQQRIQSFGHTGQPCILFMDDDILFEGDCLKHLMTWALHIVL